MAEVYEPLQRYLHRRCGPDDRDEVLNEVLLVLWRRADHVPPDNALPWTYGIARRCLANHRRGHRRRLRLVDAVGAAARPEPGPDWTSAADVALHSALESLGEIDREVVRLWAWEGLEPRDIAEVVGSTANAVSIRLTRSRAALAARIAKSDDERKDVRPAGHIRDASPEETGR